MRVGVVAVQGGFAAHLRALEEIGVEAVAVRYPEELSHLDGLVLPGGESSTQLDMMQRLEMFEALEDLRARCVPVLATCAGLILVARNVEPEQRSLGWLDVDVCRNAYGRQLDSFAARDDGGELPLVFIRAPRITRVGDEVEILATRQREPVLVRQGAVYGATFHPELTTSRRIHAACFLGHCVSHGHSATNAGSCMTSRRSSPIASSMSADSLSTVSSFVCQ